MNNLEKSELVIAKILGLLMEWGLSESSMEFPELGLDNEFFPFFATSLEWLQAEGIIRTRNIQTHSDGVYVSGPTLTAFGFQLMGKSINVGETTTTVGEAVKNTSKDTSFYTGLGDLGGGFVGGLLKSLGNG